MENNKTPSIRFKGFTDPWEQRKLGEVCSEIGDGLHSAPTYDGNGEYYFVNGNNLVNGHIEIDEVETKRVSSSTFTSNDKGLDENTILLSINGTIGNLAYYAGEKVMLGKSAAYLKVKDIKKEFLYTSLQTEMILNKFMLSLTGTTIKNLGLEAIKKTSISIPGYDEQTKVGKYFNNLDNLITLHQRKYNKLLNVKKSMLEKMFPKNGSNIPEIRFKGFTDPWEQRKVFEIADRFDNLRVPVAANLRIPGNTPYYGANGIQDYVEGYTHDGEYILVAEDGASDLKNYPVNYVNGRIWVNNHAHVLQGKEKIANNKFLSYAMRLADIESVLVGGGRAKLNADIMMNLDIAIPSFNEQEQIGAYFSNLDNLITLHQRELEKLQNIKKSMLEKMFV